MVNPVVMVKGKVVNERNMQPIEASIIYESLPEGKEEGFARSNPVNGGFSLVLQEGKKYTCYAVAEGYYSISNNYEVFDLKKYKEIDEQMFYLAPIEKDQVILLNSIKFKGKTAEFTTSSYPELRRFYEFLKANKKIVIEIGCHTNDEADPQEDLEITQKRAEAIAEYLITKGIREKQVTAKGYGQTRPVTFNKDPEGRNKNERIECVIKSL